MEASQKQLCYLLSLKRKYYGLSKDELTFEDLVGLESRQAHTEIHFLKRQIALQEKGIEAPEAYEKEMKRMRSKVIHLLCLLGYVRKRDQRPDYPRINAFIENIGSNNPQKKNLFNLEKEDLIKVLNQVERMYGNEMSRL